MSFALTKIQLPQPRSGVWLPRPRLEEWLAKALAAQRAVLVCAPAGCGKTALLARTLAALPKGHAVAWVSLDPGDDLYRLLECLLAALEAFDPPWRTAPEALLALAAQPDEAPHRQLLDELINVLAACEVPRGVIVLDDLHHVDDTACLDFLDRWLERLPARWTLAIAARVEPPLRLARLRAAGELAELREEDLRFSADESRSLLLSAGLDPPSADALHARTGGWAAGLRLAATGARGGAPGSAIDRHAFDFLATEVLARIDPELRDFLLQTSVLVDLDVDRCRTLTGDPHAAARLDEIERLGLFASVLDAASRTLRLHDLFREALQHRMRLERPSEWPALQARAAAIEPDPVRRQALLLGAQRLDEAAADLRGIAWQLMFDGGVQTLLRRVEQFPESFARDSAELQEVAGIGKWHVWAARDAEQHFVRAEQLYLRRGDATAALAARARRAIILVAVGRIDEADALLESLRDAPPGAGLRVMRPLCDTWLALERGAFGSVATHFDSLLRALVTENRLEYWTQIVPAPRLTACPRVGPLLGRWAACVLDVTGERPLPLHTLALVTQGWQALWAGRVHEAADLLAGADASAQWTGRHVIARSHSLALRAMLQMLLGEREPALAACRARIDEFPGRYGDWGLWHMLYFACRVAASCGELAALHEWLARLRRMEPTLPLASPERLRPLVGLLGTVASLEGRSAEAIALWREALQHEEQTDLLGQAHELRARLALAHLRARQPDEAAAVLAPMLAQADDGPRGALFALDALRELAAADWTSRLPAAQAATLRAWASSAVPAAAAPPAVDDGLTAREREVVALIAQGQSNKLIARALDLSPHTVKRHVANALDKLGLATRGQAAAWYHAQAARPGG